MPSGVKRLLALAAVMFLGGAILPHAPRAGAATAGYPLRPVRMIVPYPSGGPLDIIGRLLTEKLSERLGQSVVLDNRAGANGIIGTDIVAKSNPDGYTMLLTTGSHAINASLYRNLPYNSIQDFAPITQLARSHGLVLVVNLSLPVHSIKDLIALAKSRPGKLTYASGGIGTINHLTTELLKTKTGIDVLHVPYKGGGPALTDVIGGQIDLMIPSATQAAPIIKQGRVRALAITGPQRSPVLPDLPTFREEGIPGIEITGWNGLWFPARTPAERVRRMQGDAALMMASPDIKQRVDELGYIPVASTPEEFGKFIEREITLHAQIAKQAGIEPQ
jgi:tripartite-type tricarboxylate transporter receptor subunit TctC